MYNQKVKQIYTCNPIWRRRDFRVVFARFLDFFLVGFFYPIWRRRDFRVVFSRFLDFLLGFLNPMWQRRDFARFWDFLVSLFISFIFMCMYACRTRDYSGNCSMICGKCGKPGPGPGPFPGNDIRQWSINGPISSDLR